MLIVTQERDIINTRPGDDYFDRVKSFILHWLETEEPVLAQTSGSTGPPKEISLSREQIRASVAQTSRAFHLNENTLFICNLDLGFIAGKLQIIRALELNAELMVIRPTDDFITALLPHRAVLLRNSGQNFMAFVPLQLQKIMEHNQGKELLNTARAIILGGAAVPGVLEQSLDCVYAPVFATFGMTETVTHFATKRLNGPEKQENFQVLEGTEINLSSTGTLMIKNAATNNMWILTHDMARIHDDGSFEPLGRADRVINSGGVKLFLDDIEQKIDKLLALPFPYFCAGMEDEKLGERLVLFIETEQDQSHYLPVLKTNMSKFEAPKEIISIRHFLRTPTGKTDKLKTAHAYSVSNQ